MSRRSRKNVGLIGLGIIGRRVAENLRKKGFHVFVWNRTPRTVPNFVGSVAEVAELCHVIQIFVADDEALLGTVEQLSPALTPHHIVLAHSTVAPESMRSAAEIVQQRGARFLDAPFTGSKSAAEKGELIYYVGGDEAALRDARRFLEASSKEIVELGEIGDATLVKVATNMVTAATVQSAAEALALVVRYGVAPEKFERALRSNSSQSGTLTLKLPKMMSGDFEPHFSVKHMLKDLQIAGRVAQSLELDLGVTGAAHDAQLEEMKNGRGDQDYSCVVQKFFPDGVTAPPNEAANQPQLDLETAQPSEAPAAEQPPADMPAAETAEIEQSVSEPTAVLEAAPVAVAANSTAEEEASAPSSVQTASVHEEESPPRQNFFRRLFPRGGND